MLKDVPISSIPGEPPRKWISDEYFDLIIWYQGKDVAGFQLCYGKPFEERALTWHEGDRYSHSRIDSGDETATANRTPVLVNGGIFSKAEIISEFIARSPELPEEIQSLVLSKLKEYKG